MVPFGASGQNQNSKYRLHVAYFSVASEQIATFKINNVNLVLHRSFTIFKCLQKIDSQMPVDIQQLSQVKISFVIIVKLLF